MSVPSVAGFPELIQASGISIPARAKFVTWFGEFVPLISPEIFLTHVLQVINVARNGVKNYAKLAIFFHPWNPPVRWVAFWVPQPLEPSPLVWFADNLAYCPLDVGRRSNINHQKPKEPRSILMDLGTSRIHD